MSTNVWLPPKRDEIREKTSDAANARIDEKTERAIAAVKGSEAAIRARLDELDREWNVDRALMLNFAVLGGLTAALAMRTRKLGWTAVFFTQIAFLANHAIRRWCPPLPVFRRLGFRTQREIEAERRILEAELGAQRNF